MEYKDYAEKYALPLFDELDQIFEVSSATLDDFPLRNIRRHMIDKVKFNAEILEDIIHPNSTVSAFHECKFFAEEEKRELYDLYARLMGLIRTSNLLDIQGSDEKDAEFIKDTYKSWPDICKKLSKILLKLQDCWGEEEISDASVSSYFG